MKYRGYVFLLTALVGHGALVSMPEGSQERLPVDMVKDIIQKHEQQRNDLLAKQRVQLIRLNDIVADHNANMTAFRDDLYTDDQEDSTSRGFSRVSKNLIDFRRKVLNQKKESKGVRTSIHLEKAKQDLKKAHTQLRKVLILKQDNEFGDAYDNNKDNASASDFESMRDLMLGEVRNRKNFLPNESGSEVLGASKLSTILDNIEQGKVDTPLIHVSKNILELLSDWINDYLYNIGDLAKARKALQSGGAVQAVGYVNTEVLKRALEKLTPGQRLKVINDWIDKTFAGGDGSLRGDENAINSLVQGLNQILPENERVKLGASNQIVQA